MKGLGLEVETLEKPWYVNSPLGTRVSVDLICQDCELEISVILLTVDLRVMDMSEFDVILRMNWLTTHQVVIDCDRRRVTAYTLDVIVIRLREISMTLIPSRVRRLVAWAVDRVASKPYLGGQGETEYGSTSGSL